MPFTRKIGPIWPTGNRGNQGQQGKRLSLIRLEHMSTKILGNVSAKRITESTSSN